MAPADDSGSSPPTIGLLLRKEATPEDVEYFQRVSRLRDLVRGYWVDLLIALLVIAGALELVVGRNGASDPPTDLWLSIVLLAILVAPIFLRRRFPFGGPAGYWVLAAAITFYDGELIPFVGSLGVVGLATAFMLGNLRNGLKAGLGLALVTVGIVIVVYNIPGSTTTSNYVFISLRFVVAWLAGYAMRERAEQAEAAEERAVRAEREREAAARVAVAEERARIARELHDIVAHAVSVMVLQVGAVRHKLPDAMAEDRDALTGVLNRPWLDRLIDREFTQAVVFGRDLSVAHVDIDRFKALNDKYGTSVGDEILKLCAQKLQSCVRGSDLIARYSGEEFMVVLPGADRDTGAVRKEVAKGSRCAILATDEQDFARQVKA